MNTNLSETYFSEVYEQSAEPLQVTEPNVQTLITSAQESNMTKIPSEENPQIETSDTKLFDETKQNAEKFPETQLNVQTPLSPAQACNINTKLLQDDQKTRGFTFPNSWKQEGSNQRSPYT